MFASIEESDSDVDNHGEDSSSNTSVDDHMTTKRTQCRLEGAGVKEVRESAGVEMAFFIAYNLIPIYRQTKHIKMKWKKGPLL